MGAIDEGLSQIDLAAIAQVLGERFNELPEHARLDPLLHPTVDRLIWRVLARESLPRRPGPQDPEHSVEHATSINARTTLAVFANSWFGDETLDNTPLLVGELHGLLDHIRDPSAIVPDHVLKNRSKFGYLPPRFLRCVLDRKPVFLHDNSVPNLDNLLDQSRGANAPHPFYMAGRDREDMIALLKSFTAN